MSEDEMYDIIRCYEESERDYHERNIELEAENAKLRELAKRMWPFAKAYLNMLPMLGIPDSESYDIEIELKRMHII